MVLPIIGLALTALNIGSTAAIAVDIAEETGAVKKGFWSRIGGSIGGLFGMKQTTKVAEKLFDVPVLDKDGKKIPITVGDKAMLDGKGNPLYKTTKMTADEMKDLGHVMGRDTKASILDKDGKAIVQKAPEAPAAAKPKGNWFTNLFSSNKTADIASDAAKPKGMFSGIKSFFSNNKTGRVLAKAAPILMGPFKGVGKIGSWIVKGLFTSKVANAAIIGSVVYSIPKGKELIDGAVDNIKEATPGLTKNIADTVEKTAEKVTQTTATPSTRVHTITDEIPPLYAQGGKDSEINAPKGERIKTETHIS